MNKKLVMGAAATAAAGCAAAAAAKKQSNGSEPKPTMWDKMKEGMEQMPEDFPARIVFDNIESILANTEEILSLLRDRTAQHENIDLTSSTT